jgi:Family of unknown function (DUF5681)
MARKPRGRGTPKTKPSADPEPPQDHYKVGPGRPPREHQWRPGQSGNPKGRKRKEPSIEPALKVSLERALNSKVTLRRGERETVVTCAQAGIEQLAAQYAKGDRHARRDLFAIAEKLGVNLARDPGGTIDQVLADTAQSALDDYVARQMGTKEVSAPSPVLAPPELLDDDVEE